MADRLAGDSFARSLSLRPEGADAFVAPAVELGWLYGGQLLALCIRAATLTGPDGCQVQSIHAQFVGRGDAAEPLGLDVDRVRDGSALSFRGVRISQNDQVILTAQAVLHRPTEGPNYQQPAPTTSPPDEPDRWEPSDWVGFDANLGVEVREDMALATNPEKADRVYGATRRLWVRLPGLPEGDPVIAQCAMAYVSDMRHGMALKPALGLPPLGRSAQAATTDHTMWFHREPVSPDWMLLDYRPIAAASNIGLASCHIFDSAGAHLATTTQDVRYRFDQ